MSRLGRVGLAVMILVAAFAAAQVGRPRSAFACSCRATGPEQIGTYADEPLIIVFIGTVVSMDRAGDQFGQTRGELVVQRIFKGTIPAARMPVIGGGGGNCTISLEVGQRMITAARLENGVITPGLCMPYGDPTTADGQRLIDEATKAYGSGAGPPGLPAEPTAPSSATEGDDVRDLALPVALAGALGIALLLFSGLILLSRRATPRRDP